MQSQREAINHMLVRLFNDILRIEEKVLTTGEFADLSVREMHVIEAVAQAGDNNSMSAIAAELDITVGSLTVAVTTLVRKGYLQRSTASYDRRIVQVVLTEKGYAANDHHAAFHRKMVDSVMERIDQNQLDTLTALLEQLEHFFGQYQDNAIETQKK